MDKKAMAEKIVTLPKEELRNILLAHGLYSCNVNNAKKAISIAEQNQDTVIFASGADKYRELLDVLYNKGYEWGCKKTEYSENIGIELFDSREEGLIILAYNREHYEEGHNIINFREGRQNF